MSWKRLVKNITQCYFTLRRGSKTALCGLIQALCAHKIKANGRNLSEKLWFFCLNKEELCHLTTLSFMKLFFTSSWFPKLEVQPRMRSSLIQQRLRANTVAANFYNWTRITFAFWILLFNSANGFLWVSICDRFKRITRMKEKREEG